MIFWENICKTEGSKLNKGGGERAVTRKLFLVLVTFVKHKETIRLKLDIYAVTLRDDLSKF